MTEVSLNKYEVQRNKGGTTFSNFASLAKKTQEGDITKILGILRLKKLGPCYWEDTGLQNPEMVNPGPVIVALAFHWLCFVVFICFWGGILGWGIVLHTANPSIICDTTYDPIRTTRREPQVESREYLRTTRCDSPNKETDKQKGKRKTTYQSGPETTIRQTHLYQVTYFSYQRVNKVAADEEYIKGAIS